MSGPRDRGASRPGAIRLSGLVDRDVAALFAESLAELRAADVPVELELSAARVEDPNIAELLAQAIRATVDRLGAVEIRGAPTAIRERLKPSR